MEAKPIPAFYCCYLLRSTVLHSSLYVGSTPNPLRRLAQHNGQVKGGALRTSRVSLRPWEMTCLVAGFPSNIAALQFEWAWHNAHLTRHIARQEKLAFPTTMEPTMRTGRMWRHPGRPATTLTEKLSNLHSLLRSPYFSAWPLEVHFFCEDVYQVWQAWCDRVDSQVSTDIKVLLEPQKPATSRAVVLTDLPPKQHRTYTVGQGGVAGLDISYASLRGILEKGTFVLDEDELLSCDVCRRILDLRRDLIVICPHGSCRGAAHMTCLSAKFLNADPDALIPRKGGCPSCGRDVEWASLMKEMTIRVRGENLVEKILQKTRQNKDELALRSTDSEFDEDFPDYVAGESGSLSTTDVVDVDDGTLVASFGSDDSDLTVVGSRTHLPTASLPIVIEDSDDD